MTDWVARAQAVSDEELADFRLRICVTGAHPGIASIGRCSRCGGATSSGSMSLCEGCGQELGVCQYDQRMVGWGPGNQGDPEEHAVRWLALLMRGYSSERSAAARALPQFGLPGLEDAAQAAPREQRSPAVAEFIVGFAGSLPDEVSVGADFLGTPVLRVQDPLRHISVQPADAREFEERAVASPDVRFVELNRSVAELDKGQ